MQHALGDEDGRRNMRTSKELLHLEQGTPLYETRLRVCNSEASSNPVPSKRSGTFTSNIESSVLSRVKAFLPTLEAENTKLFSQIEEKGGGDFDIEVLTGGENMPHVEMDLALGVAELQTPEAVAAAELAIKGAGPVWLQDLSSNDSDIEDDSEGADSEDDNSSVPSNEQDKGRGCRGAGAVGPLSKGRKSRLISEMDRRE